MDDYDKKLLEQNVTIHWWNHGKKTLDFNGTLKQCLKERGIKFRKIKHPDNPNLYGYSFKYSFGNADVTYKSFGNFGDSVKNLLLYQLVYLGDKFEMEFNYATHEYHH